MSADAGWRRYRRRGEVTAEKPDAQFREGYEGPLDPHAPTSGTNRHARGSEE